MNLDVIRTQNRVLPLALWILRFIRPRIGTSRVLGADVDFAVFKHFHIERNNRNATLIDRLSRSTQVAFDPMVGSFLWRLGRTILPNRVTLFIVAEPDICRRCVFRRAFLIVDEPLVRLLASEGRRTCAR